MIPIAEANEILDICRNQDKMIENLMDIYDKQLTELIDIIKEYGLNNSYDKNMDRILTLLEVTNDNIINLNKRVMRLERELEKLKK